MVRDFSLTAFSFRLMYSPSVFCFYTSALPTFSFDITTFRFHSKFDAAFAWSLDTTFLAGFLAVHTCTRNLVSLWCISNGS
ncbi:hypothetical protein BKA69DRAFT_1084776 [Paraphysoderma sedebokerense]|nr:hypothetical protein BKA69DRAFT_1084776 [Paraphysoderma sedebokerense]